MIGTTIGSQRSVESVVVFFVSLYVVALGTGGEISDLACTGDVVRAFTVHF